VYYRGERRSSLADMATGLDLCSTKLAELLSEPEKGTERAETAGLEPAAGS